MQFITNGLLDPAVKKSDENPQKGDAEINGQEKQRGQSQKGSNGQKGR